MPSSRRDARRQSNRRAKGNVPIFKMLRGQPIDEISRLAKSCATNDGELPPRRDRGCGGGSYGPNDLVTRDKMAVFLLRTLDPSSNPAGCTTPMFNDVLASSSFCSWIEELARRGIRRPSR